MTASTSVTFRAPEYQLDGSVRDTKYSYCGATEQGWDIQRDGHPHLQLGPGYSLLQSSHCGVCSTDLTRRYLPFPLPHIIGHEVVARDPAGTPAVVEINASHRARGIDESGCAFCRAGLTTHCPERLVIGIHDLPGGFSPWLLAPRHNVTALPVTISPATGALIEPFAAALQAVRAVAPRAGDRIAVLGPRRLGSLVIAALAAWRVRSGCRFEIIAIARRAELRALARTLGADDAVDADALASTRDFADVVVDTTGHPVGLADAIRLAKREVHVKSTSGQPTLGLVHVTELVVDELMIAPYDGREIAQTTLPTPPARSAIALGDVPASIATEIAQRGLTVIRASDARATARQMADAPNVPFGAADVAVVTTLTGIDAAIRPQVGREQGLVRARGSILVADVGQSRDGILEAVLGRGLRLTTSRCGDFGTAIDLLADPALGLGQSLGERMITAIFPASRLADAFTAAADPRHIKVVVTHPGAFV